MSDREQLLATALRGVTDYLEQVAPLLDGFKTRMEHELHLKPIAEMLPIWREPLREKPPRVDMAGRPVKCKSHDNPMDCPWLTEVGGGFQGELYECDVCGESIFLDYEEMK